MYNLRNRNPPRSKLRSASEHKPWSPSQQLPMPLSLLDDKENGHHANIMSPVELKETRNLPSNEKNADSPSTDVSNHGSIINESRTNHFGSSSRDSSNSSSRSLKHSDDDSVIESDQASAISGSNERSHNDDVVKTFLNICSYSEKYGCCGDSTLWIYGMLQLEPDSVLDNQGTECIPFLNREDTRLAYSQNLTLQGEDSDHADCQRRISERQAFDKNYQLFSVGNILFDDMDIKKQDVGVGFLATQRRSPTCMSSFQRNLLLGEVKGDLWNHTPGSDTDSWPERVIPEASSDDIRMVDEVTSAEELDSGGFKQIFDVGNGTVLLKYPDGEEYDSRDLMITQLCSALSTVIPNFPRLCSSPFVDDRSNSSYVQMPKFAMNLWDYIRRLKSFSDESPKKLVMMSIGIQICCGVLAGQSMFGLHFRDLKPCNIMLDGDDTRKYYLMTVGSKAFVFESITEKGYGTAKIIDYSTVTVASSVSSISDFKVRFLHEMSTRLLTPLESFLLDKILKGFHRDVHNIMLMLIVMFAPGVRFHLLEVPGNFVLTLAKDIEPENAQSCYQQLVLLSKPGSSIIDLLSSDPTFQRSSKFQALKEENKVLLESKEFARDVEMFSLLQGSEFSDLRNLLGVNKVELLWKGMAPNQAFRPTLSEFMFAFFKEYMTEVETSRLSHWYEENADDDTEVIPLFLDESHAEVLLGSNKDSFVLKSDQE